MAVTKSLNPAGICTVTLSRPEALNALNLATMRELREVIEDIAQNNDVRSVIVTGAGEKAFVAGADIKELSSLSREEALELALKGQELFRLIENCPKPVIAAINGFALGGGCELAMACHIRLATANAKFGQPEINLGLIPGYGGTQRLTQLTSRGKALELLLTADLITAAEAKDAGLVNHVFETSEEMMAFAEKMLNKIVAKSPVMIRHIIRSVNAGFESEEKGYSTEASLFADCTTTADFREGTTAFVEKRKPVFRGE